MEFFEAMQHRDVVPSLFTYSTLISACEKGKQPERALQFFEAMKQQGVLPNEITYNFLARRAGVIFSYHSPTLCSVGRPGGPVAPPGLRGRSQ